MSVSLAEKSCTPCRGGIPPLTGQEAAAYQVQAPDWALQIYDNYQLLGTGTYWWTVLFPAMAIASLVVAVNLIADGISHVLER